MPRANGLAATAAALALLVVAALGLAPVASAQTPSTDATFPPTPLPPAWILVDADTGAVLAGADVHTPMPPASTIKLLTALIVAERLPVHDPVPISTLAESKPARKINVKAGQTWDRLDLLHSMLMVSANDAAYALAERVGSGSLDAEIAIADRTLDRLGTVDQPIANDPAGLDDETFSNRGGSRISAWDLAIVARAVRADPDLPAILTTPHYEFEGGDGLHHELNNHDTFLSLYVGANGMKTGGTDLAGRTFVGTATRGGRTMMVVEFDAANIYASAAQLLDQGFATPVSAEAGLEHLPAVVPHAAIDLDPKAVRGSAADRAAEAAAAAAGAAPDTPAAGADDHHPALGGAVPSAVLLVVLGLPALVVLRRRSVVRRRAARRAAARRRVAVAGPADRWRATRRPSGRVPHHVEAGVVHVEHDPRRVFLVDVPDEAHVHAVADEFS
jgi:D-alanyl-D-alanine carboxypeptidase (penicillin-binding protein 5/6)